MIEDIASIEKEANLKNEVVAAYGEVLRKLKATKQIDEPLHLHTEETLKPITNPLSDDDKNNNNYSLIDLKKYVHHLLNNLEEALIVGEKKLINLNNEISEKLKDWQKEEANYKNKRDTERQQEEKDYLHQRDLSRQKERHQYDLAKHELEVELREHKQKMQERDAEYQRIKEREAWVISKEQEYRLMKEKLTQLPEELRQTALITEKNVADNLNLKHEYEMKLLKTQMETECQLYQQTIASLKAEIAHLESLKYSFNKLAFNSKDTTI